MPNPTAITAGQGNPIRVEMKAQVLQRSWGQSIFCVTFDAICTPVGSPHDDEGQVFAKSGQEVLFGAGESFGWHDGVKQSRYK